MNSIHDLLKENPDTSTFIISSIQNKKNDTVFSVSLDKKSKTYSTGRLKLDFISHHKEYGVIHDGLNLIIDVYEIHFTYLNNFFSLTVINRPEGEKKLHIFKSSKEREDSKLL